MILTGSVYDKELPAAYKVLVMRRWPRGIKKTAIDLWLRELAPSSELLDAFRNDEISEQEFKERYRVEMQHQPGALGKVKALERVHGSVLLLCWERIPPHSFCHRFVLKEILDEVSEVPGR